MKPIRRLIKSLTNEKNMNVLLVEDDETVVEHLEFCLKRLGYDVTVALDGVAALDWTNSEKFDCIGAPAPV